MYSPFIWDVNEFSHVFGFFDGILYLVLSIYLLVNFKRLWKYPVTRIFLLILICYILVYALGVGNFGTALRHRSKFVVIFIILAAPKIQKIIFSIKKNI